MAIRNDSDKNVHNNFKWIFLNLPDSVEIPAPVSTSSRSTVETKLTNRLIWPASILAHSGMKRDDIFYTNLSKIEHIPTQSTRERLICSFSKYINKS